MISVEEVIDDIDSFVFEPIVIEKIELKQDNTRRKVLAMILSELERKNPTLSTKTLIEMLK